MTSALWWVQTVTLRTYSGAGVLGPTYADSVSVSCWVEESVEVTTDADGAELVSTATRLYGALVDADKFTPGSKAVLPSGRQAEVITVALFDSGSLGLPVNHFQAALT